MFKIINSILRALSHIAFASFLFILPVGYYYENSDSTDLVIGMHRGKGQIASIMRGCDGKVIGSESSRFKDACGSAYLSVPPGVRSPFVIGIRGGNWKSNAKFANRSSTIPKQKIINVSYYNPNISMETKYIGLGIGYISGNIKKFFRSYEYDNDSSDRVKMSWHCRLGNIEKGYLAASYAENTPLISGAGLFDIGVGYKIGKSVYMFSGLGGGFYDRCGFVQQIRLKPIKNLAFDIAYRSGSSENISESAISGGIVCQFDLFR